MLGLPKTAPRGGPGVETATWSKYLGMGGDLMQEGILGKHNPLGTLYLPTKSQGSTRQLYRSRAPGPLKADSRWASGSGCQKIDFFKISRNG
jgi:hypothetical protein